MFDTGRNIFGSDLINTCSVNKNIVKKNIFSTNKTVRWLYLAKDCHDELEKHLTYKRAFYIPFNGIQLTSGYFSF